MWSHRLYVSGEHRRVRCPKAMLYIRKNIDQYDIELLQRQYARTIQIRGLPENIRIAQTQPSDLWDNQKGLFLDPGSGLNTYFVLTVSANEYHAAFRAILACSTMSSPTCVMWTEQDVGWGSYQQMWQSGREKMELRSVIYGWAIWWSIYTCGCQSAPGSSNICCTIRRTICFIYVLAHPLLANRCGESCQFCGAKKGVKPDTSRR